MEFITPNTENIKKWVDALESGEYKQGKSYLWQEKNGVDSFCCLGVACDVYAVNNEDFDVWSLVEPHCIDLEDKQKYNTTNLPDSVVKYLFNESAGTDRYFRENVSKKIIHEFDKIGDHLVCDTHGYINIHQLFAGLASINDKPSDMLKIRYSKKGKFKIIAVVLKKIFLED